MRFAIFAALPLELDLIIQDLDAVKGGSRNSYQVYYTSNKSAEIALVITSMGSANALAAIKSIYMEFSPDIVLCTGFGGALYSGAAAGDLIWSSTVVSLPGSGKPVHLNIPPEDAIFERISASFPVKKGAVVTIDSLSSKKDLLWRLPEGLQNPVCDMETFALARYCIEKGIRFLSLRAISDTVDQDIPRDIADIVDSSGRPNILRAFGLILRKPSLMPLLVRLGMNSRKASQNLRLAVTTLVREFR
jgi:adenosylhomocysteine nucleosidase